MRITTLVRGCCRGLSSTIAADLDDLSVGLVELLIANSVRGFLIEVDP